MPPRPTLKAMLMCDDIITEEKTGKNTLVGIFSKIYGPEFPLVYFPISLYVQLTDAEGEYTFKLQLANLQMDQVIAELTVPKLTMVDRLVPKELVFKKLPPVRFETPGKYELVLYANDQVFAQASFLVEKISSKED